VLHQQLLVYEHLVHFGHGGLRTLGLGRLAWRCSEMEKLLKQALQLLTTRRIHFLVKES
jgi:HPt (histidine-containing phosphotransfer) domain-containing protein